MKTAHILFICLLLTSFAAAQNAPTVKQAESACGPFQVEFNVATYVHPHPVTPAQPGKAQIYIIEVFENPTYKIGRGPTVRLGMDGRWLGADHHDSYLVLPVEAGEHHLCANWQSKFKSLSRLISLENFTAQPGGTYYFRVRVTSRNAWKGAPWYTLNLEPVNDDEARLLLAQRRQGTSSIEK